MNGDVQKAAEMPAFPEYVGRSEVIRARIGEAPVELLAALLDRRFADLSPSGTLPPLWHWLIAPAPVRQSEIGPDGHPKRGTFLPPVPYPRRMFAGARVRFIAPLHVGDEVERTTTIKSITSKSGRSGNLLFVTLMQTIEGPRGLALTEEQDLVYRESNGSRSKSTGTPDNRGTPNGYAVVETVHSDPVLLFRYSAAIMVSHRIHYDLEYARNVEGYPNLVVHGPLQAIMLADLATRHLRRPLSAFEFRILKPVFLGGPFYCTANEENGRLLVHTLDAEHNICTSATTE